MKKLILVLMLIICSFNSFSQSIAFAEKKDRNGATYYHFYNSYGQEIKKVHLNNAKLAGYSSGLVIFEINRMYFIYSSTFRLISQVYISDVGHIEHVFTLVTGEDGFVTFKNNRYYIWDEYGKNYTIIGNK